MEVRQIKIEQGIPVPGMRSQSNVKPMLYPFAKMKKGDSFFVRASTVSDKHKVSSAAHRYFKPFKVKKYTTRSIANGIRVWRTK